MRVAIAFRGARAGASVGPTPVAVMVCIVLAGVGSVACSSGEQVSDAERTETLLGTTATTSATDTTEMSVTTTASPTTVEDTSPSATDANVNESTGRPMTVEWTDDARRVGSVEVPLDHDDPSAGTTTVRLRRVGARDPDRRIGVLFVNPGGPGATGFSMVDRAQRIFTREILQRFDIVAVAPRGTDTAVGSVSCLPFDERAELESSVDWSPDAPGELAALEAHIEAAVQRCADTNAELLDHVSTMDTVHDMARVVEALGEDQVSYLGFSYGAPLGATFATAYPELVRAAVLDAAYHPAYEPVEAERARAIAENTRLAKLYDECDAEPDCPINGGTQAAFERVARAADTQPLQSDPDLPPINESAFHSSIFFHLDVYTGAPDGPLYRAVADADAGDSTALQRRYRDTVRFQASVPTLIPINCIDWPYRDDDPLPIDLPEQLAADSPLRSSLFPAPPMEYRSASGGICGQWPAGPEPLPSPLSAEGAGPVLVLGATEDVATPIGSAEFLRNELVDAAMVYVESDVHGSYNSSTAPEHESATESVDRFLIDLERPPDGTVCAAEPTAN